MEKVRKKIEALPGNSYLKVVKSRSPDTCGSHRPGQKAASKRDERTLGLRAETAEGRDEWLKALTLQGGALVLPAR